MDPNANMAEQEALRALPHRILDEDYRLIELFGALCEWRRNGGFAGEWWRFPLTARALGYRVNPS